MLKPKAQHQGINRLIVTFTHLEDDSPLISKYADSGFNKLI